MHWFAAMWLSAGMYLDCISYWDIKHWYLDTFREEMKDMIKCARNKNTASLKDRQENTTIRIYQMKHLLSVHRTSWQIKMGQIPNGQQEALQNRPARVFHVRWVLNVAVCKQSSDRRPFHPLISRRFLLIQFTGVTRGGHQTHDHIWKEPSLWLYKQSPHVDNPQTVEDRNSFLISCSVWSYTIVACTGEYFSMSRAICLV